METIVLARHGESEYSAAGLMNGDPAVPVSLTALGRRQAAGLGRRLAELRIDLCVTTAFPRTAATADLALAGRAVPRIVVPELNDPVVGDFEGRTLAQYRAWAHAHDPQEHPPGGGESRAEIVSRYVRGYRGLQERPEGTLFVVAHGLPIRYVLNAAAGSRPAPVLEQVRYAEPYTLTADAFAAALAELEAWARRPSWANSASP